MRKAKQTLAFEMLEKEMEVIRREEQVNFFEELEQGVMEVQVKMRAVVDLNHN